MTDSATACVIEDLSHLEAVLEMDVEVLRQFGVSETAMDFLKTRGCCLIEDLGFLDEPEDGTLRNLAERVKVIQLKRVFFGIPTLAPVLASSHAQGVCKPCAWFHHAGGCRHEAECGFCHECPPGELKKRKKDKKIFRKLSSLTASFDSSTTTMNSP